MADPDTSRTITIAELAAARGITRKAARALASRRRWAKRKGNDGCLRIDVPNEELEPMPQGTPEAHREGVSQAVPMDTIGADLRTELEEARVALASVTARLEADTERTAELRQDRDRWSKLADTLRAELEAERSRSLFGRLFGRAA